MIKPIDLLKNYNAKRNFKKTQEPEGTNTVKKAKKAIFVVQKHAATRLHWDFRLELDGVLKSWAVTNEPVADPTVKRLAVEVEDHPLSYAGFSGDIPKGQYGGGHVDIWDTGVWEPIGDPHDGLKTGKLSFSLTGKRMKGHWTLVRMRREGKRNNWLLIKAKDEHTEATPKAKRADPVKKEIEKPKSKSAKKSNYHYEPALALRVDAPPDGQEWVHEIKYDGYRALLLIDKETVSVITRSGQDWTHKFPDIVAAAKAIKAESAAIDGEIIVFKDNGISDFSLLQQTLSGDINLPMSFMAFDLIELNGSSLKNKSLLERKDALQKILTSKKLSKTIAYSDHVVGHGQKFFRQAQKMKLEGIISKNARSSYQGGRNGDWVKVKITQVDEFVIAGILRRSDNPKRVGAVLLGTFENGKLRYAGKSGTGFPLPLSNAILQRAKPLAIKKSPFALGSKPKDKDVEWLKPELVGVIEYTEMTKDNLVRHGVFKGLRDDKPAKQVKAEKITSIKDVVPQVPSLKKKSRIADAQKVVFSTIEITHPDRVVYPEAGYQKQDVAAYYDRMAPFILPYLKGRPLSVIRCPDGLKKACFMQRHVNGKAADELTQLSIKDDESGEAYFSVDSKEGLLSLVQFGVIEFHPWGSKSPKFDKPDLIIFDLDPDPKIDWPSVKEAALLIKKRLKDIGLDSLPKTTGGKGIHIVVSIQSLYSWDQIKQFAHDFAEAIVKDYPEAFTTSSSKAGRTGKIYIDYLRNDYANTAIAPFSLRAREGAGFAMPLTWAKLKALKSRDEFQLGAVLKAKTNKVTDAWLVEKPVKQKLSAKILKGI